MSDKPNPTSKERSPRRSKGFLLALLVLALLFALDASRAPESQTSSRILVAAIDLYQATASPLMPRLGVRCRFEPTCSHYAEASIRSHGMPRGLWLTARRLLRCGPWTAAGTLDPPVPGLRGAT